MTATTMATPPPREMAANTARAACRRIARRLMIRRTLRVAANCGRAMLRGYLPELDRYQFRCGRRGGTRVETLLWRVHARGPPPPTNAPGRHTAGKRGGAKMKQR